MTLRRKRGSTLELTGQKKALVLAVRNDRAAERFSALYERLVVG